MCAQFVNLTSDNVADEHLCCIIRSKTVHRGVEAKRRWLADRLKEGHVFRKLNEKTTVFIEYAPLETAWVPIVGDNYYYIYCLWVCSEQRGHGYGRQLMEYCIEDARAHGRSGICMLGADKQKAWLSDQAFAGRFGFEAVDTLDTAAGQYRLLALSFDGAKPHFADSVRTPRIDDDGLTVYYDAQCPYIVQVVERVRKFCAANNVPLALNEVDTLHKAKSLPCVFNNWAIFYKGHFVTVNLTDEAALRRIINR